MKKPCRRTLLAGIAMTVLTLTGTAATETGGKPGDTGDYLPLLKEHLIRRPLVCGAPAFADRAAWRKLAQTPYLEKAVAAADKLLDAPVSAPTDELYLEYSRNGNRTRYQSADGRLMADLRQTALACLATADRKYLDKLEEQLQAVLEMKSWVLPAHDAKLETFHGKVQHIDLGSSSKSAELAVVYALLKDQLNPATAAELRRQLYFRTLDPLRRMLKREQPKDFWLECKNNWNAVCWANILTTVLAVEENEEDRLFFVSNALKYLNNSLLGFEPDGYCSEGLSYWNYGFRHNLRFAVTLYFATGGAVNLMELDSMRRPATYPERIVIAGDLNPAFADCGIHARAETNALALQDFLLDRNSRARREAIPGGSLMDAFLILALPPASGGSATEAEPEALSLFPVAGVAVARPGNSGSRLAAAFKAGSNFELHNHNDVGTYVIALDGVPMVFDPGSEVYSKRTFSKQRYESKLLNSYGHPVPVVNGTLQKAGKDTRCPVLEETIGNQEFLWRIDLAPAYQLPEIKRLERVFHYDRTGGGKVTVTDSGDFKQPVEFETALITPGKFEIISDREGVIVYRGKKLRASIDSPTAVEFRTEEIKEEVNHRETITRIGIRLKEKVTDAAVKLTFVPEK